MQMSTNGLDIEYDTFGDPSNPTILLVMGLGTQMIAWHPEFCALLADEGFQVVRFDNRDIGLSTKFHGVKANVGGLLGFVQNRVTRTAPYLLSDMADDAIGLLDGLGVEKAHIVGVSMGGMIAQEIAINHPERVLSLTSIMSSTGNPRVGQPRRHAMALLFRPPPEGRDAAIEAGVLTRQTLSPHFFDEDESRYFAEVSFDRSFYPQGAGRQLAAILASGDRTAALRELRVPALVLHGAEDPLVPLSGGFATAEAIPGSRLVTFERMGHELPRALWPEFVKEISAHAHGAA
ncbi:MAG: alpha/beta fold hydrolase [Acidimicrobiia bacterium]|nr:alpha/beta fold hydrolase [Acidimicrobiia bacterium]